MTFIPINIKAAGIILFLISCLTLYSQPKKVETGDIKFVFKKSESFTDAALLDIMLLPREKYFNRINLEEDLQRLNKFYFDNGFFDAFIDTSTVYNKSDEQVDIKFTIIENPQYIINEVRLQGLDSIPAGVKDQIYNNMLIEAGNPYNKNKINLERDRIIGVLQDNGYFYAQIDTVRSKVDSSRRGIIIGKYSDELQKNPEFKNKVLVRMRFIGTKDIYRFGKNTIRIDKNKYNITKAVIERELKFKEGEIFSKSKMLESERNFSKMPIIQLGRIIPDTVYQSSKTVDTKVDITLTNKYELTPGIYTSYQSNRLYLGINLVYKDKDFFGGGRTFSVTAEGLYNSTYINGASLEFKLLQPYLFNNNITAELTSEIAYLNLKKGQSAVTLSNLLRLSYYIADYTFYNQAYSDITFDYLNLNIDLATLNPNLNEVLRVYVVNSILSINLVHNNTNNLFNPSKGFYHSISLASAGLLPKFMNLFNPSLLYSQYIKLGTSNSFYFDISGDRATSIVAKHFEIGDIIEYGSGSNLVEVPILYRYFMGGGNSLRGWRAQTGGILDTTENGGKFLIYGSIEWRRKPFPQRSFLNPIWGVLFLDYGNVWKSGKDFKFNQIALATGFGIRYDSFVGPIRLDIGFKLYDPVAKDGEKWLWQKPSDIFKSKYAIQFGLGNAF